VDDNIAGYIGIGSLEEQDLTCAIRFLPNDLTAMEITSGQIITKIALGVGTGMTYIFSMEIQIWEGGTSVADPGTLVYQQPVTNYASFIENSMNEIDLTSPYTIDITKELRIGYQIAFVAAYPFGRDAGPAIPDKGLLTKHPDLYSGAWFCPTEQLGWNFNLSMKAYIEKAVIHNNCDSITNLTATFNENNLKVELFWNAPENVTDLTGYSIYRNDVKIYTVDFTATEYLDDVSELETDNYTYCIVAEYAHCSADKVCVEVTTIGIDEWSNGIVIFPNPTKGQLTITNYELQITNVEIFDVYGRNVLSHTAYRISHTAIDISELQAGSYFVKITTDKGIIIKKIIKLSEH
jgi:hypothetical protein